MKIERTMIDYSKGNFTKEQMDILKRAGVAYHKWLKEGLGIDSIANAYRDGFIDGRGDGIDTCLKGIK